MKFIKFDIEHGVAQIIFNRPEVFNATHTAMRNEILKALDRCEKDTEIRVIYLSGIGRAFCAGQDLQEIVDPEGPALSSILSDGYNPIVLKIRQIEKPVLCAVNGVAAGAGANIAFACDITVATASASFTQAFSKIGLIPDSGGTWTLPRLVGMQRAAAMMMFSEKVSANDAANMGLIWKVISDEDFKLESLKMAKALATFPREALALTKRALNQSFNNDFEAQLVLEDKLQTIAGNSSDYKEGVNAFLQKRKPRFG
jgi:2-(1,2-epoxy-1,2-dihydrophenyl)acetyl-CoA isomerase